MNLSIEKLWRDTVDEHASRLALHGPAGPLTYKQLDHRARMVAATLHEQGAPAIAIRGPDHAAAIVAMMGGLLAGVPFVLVDHHLSSRALTHVRQVVAGAIWLDELVPIARADVTRGRPVETTSHVEADAYVLFTSGSAGLPKGVRISRENLIGFIDALGERLQLKSNDIWLQVASLGFDVVIEEVLPVLFHGGAVAVRSNPYDTDPETLHHDLVASRATIVELSTRYWYEYKRWLDLTDAEPPSDLRVMIVGGERMDSAVYRDWQDRDRVSLVHVYGLTECTVTSTMYSGRLGPEAADVPVGTALTNSQVLVDIAAAPEWASIGVGEIVLGGSSVGRGYLAVDAEAAARFTNSAEGDPIFRTGDLGYFDADGQLVFAGRLDEQVKVRGRRVELSDLDHVLSALPGVGSAAAVIEPGPKGRLVAFVCPAAEQTVPLPSQIAVSVPAWAVPAIVHVVPSIPVTAHGKTDRAALLTLHGATFPVPTTSPELTNKVNGVGDDSLGLVLRLMRSVLNKHNLEPDDDFFDHGGNSLMTLELVTLLRESLGTESTIRPRTIFTRRSARAVAEHVSESRNPRPTVDEE